MTTNPNVVTEEEKKDDVRIDELSKKTDKNEEETKELGTLKENKSSRLDKRIGTLTWRAKDAEERFGKSDERVKVLEAEVEELKNSKPPEKPVIVEETVTHGGKAHYTDEALKTMVDAGTMTETQAYKLQRTRDKAEILEEVKSELGKTSKETEVQKVRKDDAKKVIGEYPNFRERLPDGKLNPDFDPEDPLYKLTNELYKEGLGANPLGMSLALKRAKQILRKGDKPIDLSEDLGVHSNSSSPREKPKEEEATLNEYEQETSIAQWCKGDTTNPATGRPYTEPEALAKGLAAKKALIARRKK